MSQKIFKCDSQILDGFSRCETLGEYSFIKNLQPIESSFSIQRGSLCHDILKTYYDHYKSTRNKINSHQNALDFGRARINHYDSIDIPRGMEILDTMREYFTFTMGEKWIPIDTEQIHKKVIYEDEDLKLLYVAKIDVTVAGEPEIDVMPVDHKTYDRWYDPLSLENQFTGYCHILGVNRITVNKIGFQKSYPPEKKFRRIALNYTNESMNEWVHNTARLVKDMIFNIESGAYPMRRTQCGMYGGCRFKMVCEVDPRARPGIIEKFFKVTEPWDPERLEERDE